MDIEYVGQIFGYPKAMALELSFTVNYIKNSCPWKTKIKSYSGINELINLHLACEIDKPSTGKSM